MIDGPIAIGDIVEHRPYNAPAQKFKVIATFKNDFGGFWHDLEAVGGREDGERRASTLDHPDWHRSNL